MSVKAVIRRKKKDYKRLMANTNQIQELCWFTSGMIVNNPNNINYGVLFPTFVDCWNSQRTIGDRDSLLHNISSTITLSVGSKTGKTCLIQPDNGFSYIERISFTTVKHVRREAKNIMLKACDYMRVAIYKPTYVSDWRGYLVGFPTEDNDYSKRIVNIINSLGGRVSEDMLYNSGKIIYHYKRLFNYYADNNPLTACMMAAIVMNSLRGSIVNDYAIGRQTAYESTYDETLRITTIILFLQAVLNDNRLKNVLKIDSINNTEQIVKVFTLLQTLFYTLFDTISRRLKLFVEKQTISKRVVEDNKNILTNKDYIVDNSVKFNMQYCAFYNITTRNLRLRVNAVNQVLRVYRNMSNSDNVVLNDAIDSIISKNVGLEPFRSVLSALTAFLGNSHYKTSKNRISIIGDNMSLKDPNIARLVLETMMDEPFDRWRDTNTVINSMNSLEPNISKYLAGSNGIIGRTFIINLCKYVKNNNKIRRKSVMKNFDTLIKLANRIVKLSFKACEHDRVDFIYEMFQERVVDTVYDANNNISAMKIEYSKLVKDVDWFRYGYNISAVRTIFGKTVRFDSVNFNEYEVIADALRDINKTVVKRKKRVSKRVLEK